MISPRKKRPALSDPASPIPAPDGMTPAGIIAALTDLLGLGAVLPGIGDITKYTVDWRKRFHGDAICVVLPKTTSDVAQIMRFCWEHRVPVIPQGGNTGLRGAATPFPGSGAVIVSMERMNAIRSLDRASSAITVDAGCVLQNVQQAAADAGLLFPLEIGSQGSCQIGGNIATNAGGLTVMRYGTIRDLMLGIEVVLPDGRVMNMLRSLRKVSAGYDLKHLFVSSEGTLGIITAATLKLFPRPRSSATAWIALPNLVQAVPLLERLRDHFQERLTSYEVLSRGQLELVFKHCANTRDPLDGGYPWAALIQIADASSDDGLQNELEEVLATALEDGLAENAVIAANSRQTQDLWYLREGLSMANVAEGRHVSHDTIVPIAALPEFIERVTERVLAAYPDAVPISSGHVGDGNIHAGFMFQHARFPTPDDYEQVAREINAIVFDVTYALGGGFCAEHGIGIPYREPLSKFADPVELAIMKSVKTNLDNRGIMNPGKIFLPPNRQGERHDHP